MGKVKKGNKKAKVQNEIKEEEAQPLPEKRQSDEPIPKKVISSICIHFPSPRGESTDVYSIPNRKNGSTSNVCWFSQRAA